ncbi:hypothetical protein PVAND_013127 [Polypedilum vanderplanki]|uniref:Uncharacterized protein n=1 Tax=Polypedilum vanderplanki TaxID=319348 RepID=A0A9J6CNJ1_POLVA|nr:hypothetical protein PVAND_013127 [Polypedilum vanderplanki]
MSIRRVAEQKKVDYKIGSCVVKKTVKSKKQRTIRSEIDAEVVRLYNRLDRFMMSFAIKFLLTFTILVIVRVTSMPAGEQFTTENTFIEYESIDLLNKLPFSPSPSVDYIADFDESVDLTTVADATYRDLDGRIKMRPKVKETL